MGEPKLFDTKKSVFHNGMFFASYYIHSTYIIDKENFFLKISVDYPT